MSDRIDELARRAVDPNGWERGQAVAELATIAREAEARGFGHTQVVRLRDSVRQMLEYIGRHEQFCDAAALVAYDVDEMLRAVIPSTGLQRALWAADERALKAEARAIEKEQKYREADERAWACESVGIPGLEARALEAEAMCEWLVKYAADCDECPRTRYDENEDGCRECLDSIRRIAREVVARSDHTYG